MENINNLLIVQVSIHRPIFFSNTCSSQKLLPIFVGLSGYIGHLWHGKYICKWKGCRCVSLSRRHLVALLALFYKYFHACCFTWLSSVILSIPSIGRSIIFSSSTRPFICMSSMLSKAALQWWCGFLFHLLASVLLFISSNNNRHKLAKLNPLRA